MPGRLQAAKLADVVFLNVDFEVIDYVDTQPDGCDCPGKEEKEAVGMVFHYAVQTGVHDDDDSNKRQAEEE